MGLTVSKRMGIITYENQRIDVRIVVGLLLLVENKNKNHDFVLYLGLRNILRKGTLHDKSLTNRIKKSILSAKISSLGWIPIKLPALMRYFHMHTTS